MLSSASNQRKRATISCDGGFLPDEMIVEVLLQLPVKSIMCFRVVSRSWAALFAVDEFCRLYMVTPKATPPKLLSFSSLNLTPLPLFCLPGQRCDRASSSIHPAAPLVGFLCKQVAPGICSFVAKLLYPGPGQQVCSPCSPHRAQKFWGPKISVFALYRAPNFNGPALPVPCACDWRIHVRVNLTSALTSPGGTRSPLPWLLSMIGLVRLQNNAASRRVPA
ncbi:hypothetical protein QYE76_001898 [Lolium multiflorum]|uniref:F-box domain-containing protein n=1 Tax=Lolium multiflorum TaxID=4521 RepID=A0AAD8RKN1_LOLMU|nr:hypothetical protein QYE76_001898 [Lolium multiflorum]